MRAVIITENQYPLEDAGAIRQHATAKLLESAGYSVIVFGYGKSTKGKVKIYDGIEYISFRPASSNKFVRALYRITAPSRMMSFLRRMCGDADLILVADVFSSTIKKVNKYAKYKGTLLIHDSVEWFSAEQFSGGERARAFKERDKINRSLVRGNWRVMAISSYLEEHFKKQCDRVVRIPVVMDMSAIEYNGQAAKGGKIKFAYVGSPGKKDYLENMLEAFDLLEEEQRSRAEFHIVGVTMAQLVSICGVSRSLLDRLGNFVIAHGRVPHSDAIRFVREADYTLLVRDSDLRYSKAGFPTKIVESLASGTPPICNISSDLGLYLVDGKNAFIAEDHSPLNLKCALEKAIETSYDQRNEMRGAARKTAEVQFDHREYKSEFSKLLDKL